MNDPRPLLRAGDTVTVNDLLDLMITIPEEMALPKMKELSRLVYELMTKRGSGRGL